MRTIDFVDSFDVDAGNISALDAGFIEEYGGDRAEAAGEINVVPRRYLVVLHSDDTYNGVVTSAGVVNCESGCIVIGDVCYTFPSHNIEEHAKWSRFLQETNFCEDYKGRGVCLRTGGDGRFVVNVIVKALPELQEEE